MTILLGIIAISILIFVHELGHFLAAKWAGARVKTFALGFDPTVRGIRLKLVSWRWGETEYVIGLIPFGGYVQPADPEEGADQEKKERGEFASQPPGKRAVIFAAGATMNIIFGFAAFAVAFSWGVSFQSPEVGSVVPGSAAWYAGVRPRDTIAAIDGTAVESFDDVAVSVALGGRTERLVTVEREGRTDDVRLTPRLDPVLGILAVGIQPKLARPLAEIEDGSTAERAGLRSGDVLLGATFRPGENEIVLDEDLPVALLANQLGFLAQQHPGQRFELRVQSPGGTPRVVPLTIGADVKRKDARLGVRPASRTAVFVRPHSAAAELFQPGDTVKAVDGGPLPVIGLVELTDRVGARRDVAVLLASGKEFTVDRQRLLSWIAGGDLFFGGERTVILEVRPESRAATAGLAPGDRILACNGVPVGDEKRLEELIGSGSAKLAVLARTGATVEVLLPAAGELGIVWDHRPRIGSVVPESPAAEAGIRPRDVLVQVDGKDIGTFEDLVDRVQRNGGEGPMRIALLREGRPDARDEVTATPAKVPVGELGISFDRERIILRDPNVLSAIGLGVKRTVVWIKRILVTVVSLARGDVAARNLQGPVGIVHITGYVTRYGFGTLLYILALISVNLGVLNLLPLPIFDGGHLLLLALEKIKGSPVNERLVQGATTVMLFLLIALAIYVTYHDILRIMP